MTAYSYCTHDEGESCHCGVELCTTHVDRAVIPAPAAKHVPRTPRPITDGRSALLRREEVRHLLTTGLTAKIIAQRTGMHVRTVERHMAVIRQEQHTTVGEMP